MTTAQQPIPATGFVRQSKLLPIIGISPSTLWRWVNNKTFPQPVKLSAKVTAWKAEEVREWIASQGQTA